MEDDGSCGTPVWARWSAELHLSRGESFEDEHRSAAARTLRQELCSRCLADLNRRFWWLGETVKCPEAEREQGCTLSVREEAEVADADEAAWEQVQEEAAQELIDRQLHEALAVAVRRVSPAEGHLPVSECEEPAVGDADAMGVCTEVAEHMFRSTQGWLGVDNPVVTIETSEPSSEAARLG